MAIFFGNKTLNASGLREAAAGSCFRLHQAGKYFSGPVRRQNWLSVISPVMNLSTPPKRAGKAKASLILASQRGNTAGNRRNRPRGATVKERRPSVTVYQPDTHCAVGDMLNIVGALSGNGRPCTGKKRIQPYCGWRWKSRPTRAMRNTMI